MVGCGVLGQLDKTLINLNAEHGAGLLSEPSGQAAGAATDFDHGIVARGLRRANDQVKQVQVDQEVLAELALGPDAVLLEEIAQVGERLSWAESAVDG